MDQSLSVSSLPKVSIGIPVFNGAKTLARTIEAAINQDYENLEIIISDNCSTDETQMIAENYQATDPRIKYVRQEKNLGMTANFTKVFEYSTGEFFMWAAHDDQHAPTFISSCLPYLLKDTQAGLCVPKTQAIFRNQVDWISSMKTFSEIDTRVKLFRETLRHFPAVGMYGLYRSSIIQKTALWRNFLGADLVFIQSMSLHGNIVTSDEILFSYSERENWNTLNQDYANIYCSPKKPWFYSPFIVVLVNQVLIVVQSENTSLVKIKLLGVLLTYQIGQVIQKVPLKLLRKITPQKYKVLIASRFYWKYMHNPNVEVVNMTTFIESNLLPMVGLRRGN
jgi:glycosyltransferase involved in cell wall biosynthesis